MQFSMNATWQRGTALVGNNLQLLAVIAGVFLFLPSVVIYMAVPDMASFMDPTADPEVMAQQMQGAMGPLIGWGLLAMVFQFVGYLAMVALMGGKRPTVGEAIGSGFKALLTVIGCMILFILIYMLVAVGLMLPIALLAGGLGSGGIGVTGIRLVFGAILFIMTRLSVTMPAIMLEDRLNPAAAMWRSWQLTGPFKWPIFGFWLLLGIAYFVLAILLFGVFGMVGALATTSSAGVFILGVVNGLVGALIAMVVSGLVVAMYQQLAGDRSEDLEEVFD